MMNLTIRIGSVHYISTINCKSTQYTLCSLIMHFTSSSILTGCYNNTVNIWNHDGIALQYLSSLTPIASLLLLGQQLCTADDHASPVKDVVWISSNSEIIMWKWYCNGLVLCRWIRWWSFVCECISGPEHPYLQFLCVRLTGSWMYIGLMWLSGTMCLSLCVDNTFAHMQRSRQIGWVSGCKLRSWQGLC